MTKTSDFLHPGVNSGAGALAGPQGTQPPNKSQFALTDLGIFNVKDYGATGDGATDETAAIAAAIAAALAVNGAVYFPAGRYVVSNINIPNGIRQVFGPGIITDSKDSGGYDAVVTLGGSTCITGTAEMVELLDWSVSIEVGQATTVRALACGALCGNCPDWEFNGVWRLLFERHRRLYRSDFARIWRGGQ